MTTEEKREALRRFCDSVTLCTHCLLHTDEFRCGRGESVYCMTEEATNRAFEILCRNQTGLRLEATEKPHILDSGERRHFETGAVRDIQEGKGRCDLMPLDVIALQINSGADKDCVLQSIYLFTDGNDIQYLYFVVEHFRNMVGCDMVTLLLEVSKHFEEGAKKYGEHNWQKGIPVKCYIDSAVRHYLKWLRGDNDEPHDRAFVWNILCCIWTCIHKPELNDYRKDGETE